MPQQHPVDPGKNLTVTIHDEDSGGPPISLPAGPGTPVRTVIERLYAELGTERRPGDRLRCLANGSNVFGHEAEHLGDYAVSVCTDLVWAFARDTGGAEP